MTQISVVFTYYKPWFYVLIHKSTLVKTFLLFILSSCTYAVSAQTSADTGTLKAQKENIITAGTVLKIENLGIKVNSDLAELRPTISADGNLLFFICHKHTIGFFY